MAFLKQNMNQFAGAPVLGQVDLIPTPDVVSAQIDPASVGANMQVTSAFKLKTGTSGAILVDIQTGPTDATIFGIVPYNQRGNIYKAGDIITLIRSGYVYMRSGAAVVRGTTVSLTAATSTSDPLVATDATSGHFTLGLAIDEASAADQLIRVQVRPATNP